MFSSEHLAAEPDVPKILKRLERKEFQHPWRVRIVHGIEHPHQPLVCRHLYISSVLRIDYSDLSRSFAISRFPCAIVLQVVVI